MRTPRTLIALSFDIITGNARINAQNVFPSNGNAGIGTSTPAVPLHLFQNASDGFALRLENTNAAGDYKYMQLMQVGSNAFGITDWPHAGIVEGAASGGLVLSALFGDLKFQTSGSRTTKMTIKNSSGNVGIGTNNPLATLTVNAGNQTSGDDAVSFVKPRSATNAAYRYTFDGVGGVLANNIGAFWRGFHLAAPYITVNGANTFPRLAFYAEYDSYTDPTIRKWVINAGNSTIAHDIQFASNDLTLMTLKANGSVGIGTINTNDAAYKLFVEIGIRTRKIKVDQTNWPDYVFHNTYQLRPLNEVEQYIQQNHHLPEVPSAAQVEKDGLNLGDNQATLLKKIEELTLYVIEQNKNQESQNQQMKKQQELINKLNNLVESQQKRISVLEKNK